MIEVEPALRAGWFALHGRKPARSAGSTLHRFTRRDQDFEVPTIEGDPDRYKAFAFCFGYIQALLQVLRDE